MSNDDDAAMRKVTELLHDHRFGMLTTTAQDGTLVSRPMTMQEVEFDGDLWFFAERESRKIAHIGANPRVNVACGSGTDWVSVSGSATVVDDRDRVHELWNGGAQAWFPDGPDSPSVVLLRVRAEGAEYWDVPGGRLATLVNLLKARATGERFDAGENATTRM